jgi:hypothetical protein
MAFSWDLLSDLMQVGPYRAPATDHGIQEIGLPDELLFMSDPRGLMNRGNNGRISQSA